MGRILKLVSLIILFQLSACASVDAEMQRWVGKPITTVIAFWGPPTSVTPKHTGTETYYAWRVEFCVKTFTVNKQGIVTGWTNYNCVHL
jgi:hypothetical protein